MKRILVIGVVLLACAAALVPGEIRAQAEGRGVAVKKSAKPVQQVPISPEERVRQLGEMKTWLRRLVGKYRTVETMLQGPVIEHCISLSDMIGANCALPRPSAIAPYLLLKKPEKGSAECKNFAAGPGVSCRMTWGHVTELFLFGLDPDVPGIRLLWARGGINIPALGSRRDDTVTFHTEGCPWIVQKAGNLQGCIPVVLFRAKLDGEGIEFVWQHSLASPGFNGLTNSSGGLFEWRRIDEPGR